MIKRISFEWADLLIKVGVTPKTALDWSDEFSEFFAGDVFSSGDKELPDFLSQVLHETGRLQKMQEDLNYSSAGMMRVWPTRFPSVSSTLPYVFNPMALANKVYGGRYGNNTLTDGWNYRGSGLVQTTFKSNFMYLEDKLQIPVVDHPELLRAPGILALKVALTWWEGKVPDYIMGQVKKVRMAVNGGTLGLDDTTMLYNKLKGLL